MKALRIVSVLLLVAAVFMPAVLYAESIYKTDGSVIQAKVVEKTEDAIWVETTTGDIVEQTSIDLSEVNKVLNDDGSVSQYSPA